MSISTQFSIRCEISDVKFISYSKILVIKVYASI